MRCFIAIDVGEKIRAALSDLQQQLAGSVDIKKGDVKWFLGEIEDAKVVEVCNIVKDVAAGHKSFELAVESVGYFGGRRPSVLWVGAGENNSNLHQLQKDIEKKLALAGWPQDSREFAGHLTLCRVRNPKAGVKLAQITEDYRDFKLGIVSADSVSVYQSQLTPTGPVYTILGNYKMREE